MSEPYPVNVSHLPATHSPLRGVAQLVEAAAYKPCSSVKVRFLLPSLRLPSACQIDRTWKFRTEGCGFDPRYRLGFSDEPIEVPLGEVSVARAAWMGSGTPG